MVSYLANAHTNAYVLNGTDTILMNRWSTVVDRYRNFETVTQNITVTGETGLTLNIYGGICYLILMSDDGANIEQVALDYITAPSQGSGVTSEENSNRVQSLMLSEKPMACPNPFNPTTQIRFIVPAKVSATYAIYNINGQCLHSVKVPAMNNLHVRNLKLDCNVFGKVAAGIYYGRLSRSDSKRLSHRLLLIK
jgi:hypothetical protein